MKKRDKLTKGLVALLIILTALSPIVNASSSSLPDFQTVKEGVDEGLNKVSRLGETVFGRIIGDYESAEFLFTKFLLFILLLVITKKVLEKTPLGDNKSKIGLILSIIVSILAIRFISQNDLVETILIPYGAIGVAITTILPLVIFFFFVHRVNVGTFGRKLFWVFFSLILIAIWLSKWSDLSDVGNGIYLSCIGATVILVLYDRKIHKYLGMSDIKGFERALNKKDIEEEKRNMAQAKEDYNRGVINIGERNDKIREAKRRIRELSGE